MKYLNLLVIAIIISSCCSTKQVAQTSSKDIAKVEKTKPQDDSKKLIEIKEVPTPKEDMADVEIEETIQEKEESKPQPEITKAPKTVFFNHSSFNNLLQKHVTVQGNVNYKNLRTDTKALRNYIAALGENMPTNSWTKEAKLAYWINAYNSMTIDLILRNYPVKSIKDIKDPWKQRLWKLGEKWYNLDEIEHQIIRKMGEPRIHFALVCAAKSCPKLYNKAFTAQTLEDDLSKLTREFLADESKNNISQNNLRLSKIFKWFTKDFKQNGSLIDFLNQYSNVTISEKAPKSFKDYNWDLND